MIKDLLKKYWDVISYLFFGVCTTIINIVSYQLFYELLNVSNVISTIVAWILSVAFAYITNRMFVFHSSASGIKNILKEISSFVSCRLLTGFLDLGIMFLAVDVLSMNGLFWKIVSNVLVIILNYIFSKLFIFKKKD